MKLAGVAARCRLAAMLPRSAASVARQPPPPLLARTFLSETLGRSGREAPIFVTDHAGAAISPWHDIPLRRAGADNVFNMVCEVPRGSTPKFEVRERAAWRRHRGERTARVGRAAPRQQHLGETNPWTPAIHSCPPLPPPSPPPQISTTLERNPIVQDRNKDGSARFYAFTSLTNYGALPQTYEDPRHKVGGEVAAAPAAGHACRVTIASVATHRSASRSAILQSGSAHGCATTYVNR
jgi:hypothetical protein